MSIRRAALAGLVCAGLAGCDEPQAPIVAEETILSQIGDYAGWARPMTRQMRAASTTLHGSFVDVYVNDVVAADEANVMPPEGGLKAWTDGAVMVIEGFDMLEGGTRVQRALMQKRRGVWYWEQYLGDASEPRFSGRVDVCRGCHSSGQDYVRSFRLPSPP